jgi:hypothetical protein
MNIRFLKDFNDIQHKKDDVSVLNEMDKVFDNQIRLCIGHGSYVDLNIGEDVELVAEKQTMEEFLRKLYKTLKEAQKRWCDPEDVDDAEEMWTEYPPLIDGLIPQIEELLEIPLTGLVVKSAIYGSGSQIKDVKEIIEDQVDFNKVSIQINNKTMSCDPAPNKVKELKIIYSYLGVDKELIINEGRTLKLP